MQEVDLVFSGPGVSPGTLDAKLALEVALAYVETLVALAEDDYGGPPPFKVVLKRVEKGSVRIVLAAHADDANDQIAGQLFETAAKRVDVSIREPYGLSANVRPKALRLAEATRNVPPHVKVVTRKHGGKKGWKYSLSDAAGAHASARLRNLETLRGIVVRAGGVPQKPRVMLYTESDGLLPLRANMQLAKRAGKHLYEPAEVDVEIIREARPGQPIVLARLRELRFISEQDPVKAWDDWYDSLGRPWSDIEDIEGKLRHG